MIVYRRGGGIVFYICVDLERGCFMGLDGFYFFRKFYEIYIVNLLKIDLFFGK